MMSYPGVGTGIWVRKQSHVLLGLRKGGAGAGMWCAPGGKLEMYEAWEECALRETKEETGLEVAHLRFAAVTNDMSRDIGSHFVTLHYVADWRGGEAALTEPDKFEKWEWFALSGLPEPLFWPTRNFIKSGYNPFII